MPSAAFLRRMVCNSPNRDTECNTVDTKYQSAKFFAFDLCLFAMSTPGYIVPLSDAYPFMYLKSSKFVLITFFLLLSLIITFLHGLLFQLDSALLASRWFRCWPDWLLLLNKLL